MARHPELLLHLQTLLAAELWPEALLHLQHGARHVQNRQQARELRPLVDRFPPSAASLGAWPRALAWVAYRTADSALLERALGDTSGAFPAFEAFQASLGERWPETLTWSDEALGNQHSLGAGEAAIAARFRACALAELGRRGWAEAYEQAALLATGRDRGLALLEFAHQLSSHEREAEARDAYARALPELRTDPSLSTLTYANLGITCLRLGLIHDAGRALRTAHDQVAQGEGVRQLSTIWRGLGGVSLHRMQLERAQHAFAMALQKADTGHDRLAARRGSARVYRMQGRYDEALTELHQALRQDHSLAGPHPFYADLAALDLLVGDVSGAARRLEQVPPVQGSNGWRVKVVQAELARRAGTASPEMDLRDLALDHTWAVEEARVFPELFALLGLSSARPPWTAELSADGPLQVTMSGEPVPLRPSRVSSSLLAFLIFHQGQTSAERALEALDLPGKNVRARKQSLSKAVAELREVLGWPDAVLTSGGLLGLSRAVDWAPLRLPAPDRTDLFCEGRMDPWVELWKHEHDSRIFSAFV